MRQKIDINKLIDISIEAGNAIMNIYNDESQFNIVDYKTDDSPLTLADKISHEVITDRLITLYPDIPILSEEGSNISYNIRNGWPVFWLVDPLDGTKEFIKRNGEFTVNIALIEKNHPTLGIIYVPDKKWLYYGEKGLGAWKTDENSIHYELKVQKKISNNTAVRSRSHGSPEEEELYIKHKVSKFISVGSSLKFCMVAEGKADIYYRHGPTMEWDTAAGQAIVEAAGGKVMKGQGLERFSYNKESLLNDSFLVSS
ncbi:3'(2'),5'-bisphosphate nucleotidase CysQ [Bacteroidota bacterium]